MTERSGLAAAFLKSAGWGPARQVHLAGDASDRRYARLHLGRKTAVLMDAPPGKGDDPADFIKIGAHLNKIGLSAPRLLAKDLTGGFLLLEDLGDGVYARLLEQSPELEPHLYETTVDLLVYLQSRKAPKGLSNLSAQDWAEAAGLAPDLYAFAIAGEKPDRSAMTDLLFRALARHADGPRVLILRDFHSENLIWLPRRTQLRQVGLLDFQLGQMGQPGYDLVSLLQDARRDVSLETETAMKRRFAQATGIVDFDASFAVLGAQRALRIIGIFARLALVGNKLQYLPLIPRVWGQLQRNLAHPALADLSVEVNRLLPPPTPTNLQRIASLCQAHP